MRQPPWWTRVIEEMAKYQAANADNLPGAVFAITEMPAEDGTVELWMSADAGLVHFSGKEWATVAPASIGNDGDNLVMGLVPSSREPGVLWIGTSGGGVLRRGPDGQITPFNHDDSPRTISPEVNETTFVRSIYFHDPDGIRLELAAWARPLTPADAADQAVDSEARPLTPA